MKKAFTLFIILIFSVPVLLACSCFGETNFCSSATSELSGPPDVIVTAKKTEDVYYGMRVEVIEVLQGETDRDTLMVWGDNGALCRVYTNSFSIGDTLILSLFNTDFSGNFITAGFPPNLEQEGDYHLSICGVYFLPVQNGMVSGPIDPDTDELSYEAFKEVACLVLGIPPVPGFNIDFFPNPADQEIHVYFRNSQPYPVSFTIFDAIGRLVAHHSSQQVNFLKTLDVGYLENGVYVLYIRNEGRFESRKFVVAR